jgi:hypothetical protein
MSNYQKEVFRQLCERLQAEPNRLEQVKLALEMGMIKEAFESREGKYDNNKKDRR